MNVLIDTCIWSLAFRRRRPEASVEIDGLGALIIQGRAKIIGPIRQEILSGLRDEDRFRKVRTLMSPFPDIELISEDFVAAARFCNGSRAEGVQGSNTDFLICAVASRLSLSIFTTDKDFDRFAGILPINLHKLI